MKTKIRFGFRNKNQLPFFMIWKEWKEDGATVLGCSKGIRPDSSSMNKD